MLRTLDFRGDRRPADLRAALPRAAFDVEAATHAVQPILDRVRAGGAEAIRAESERLDGVRPEHLRVPAEAMAAAEADLDPELREALLTAIERRRAVAAVEVGEAARTVTLAPGATVTHRLVPVQRVGLYVPGGVAPLASSVIMNVVPAQAAGVSSLAIASPPQKEFGGLPHPTILATCALLGVTEVYAVGGAQAIAMFAYGVPGLCERVDMITGPGNIYVVAAKRLVKGLVGIDAEAGPTEIAVLADDTAVPRHVAADLISQAEHAADASAVLITASAALIEQVRAELAVQVPAAKHAERIGQALAGEQSAAVLVDDLAAGLDVADAYAAEHLEIQTADAAAVAARVHNAGAIFVGGYAPVSLGDYLAGSTHVLPTAGCACHSAGLTSATFLREVHVINYDEPALREVARRVQVFAEAEDLPSHGRAVTIRFDGE